MFKFFSFVIFNRPLSIYLFAILHHACFHIGEIDRIIAPTALLAYRGQHIIWTGFGKAMNGLTLHLTQQSDLSPEMQAMFTERYEQLLARDYDNAKMGIYPWSLLFQIPYATYARTLPRLLQDIPDILRRREAGKWKELPTDEKLDTYPPYYRRTFHWQRDGYLSRHSAEIYDAGVEMIFGGTADVMRRQVIPPIVAYARRQRRPLRILEVACGTGQTAAQILSALPDAHYTGLDISPHYIEYAHERLWKLPGGLTVDLVAANAETLPFDNEQFDAVFSVYLFHELPRNARRNIWDQIRRVLRPGGCLVIEDSVQRVDSNDLVEIFR